ncbi:MAG: NADH-quinone oxidoreductase subunit H, partial [Candidatus Ranarchaeia archaeon]
MQLAFIDNFWIWVNSMVQLVWDTGELFYNLIPLIPQFYRFDWLVHMIIFPGLGFIGIGVMGIVWLERKTLAKVNLRIGPLYAGRYFGILQLIADVTKMLQKEIIHPRKVHKFLFVILPLVTVTLSAALFTVLPTAPGWVISELDYGLLLVFAVMAAFPTMAMLVGWASNSPYPFIGSVRALLQQVSYEVPLWLSAIQ